jgi:hypothetical protein
MPGTITSDLVFDDGARPANAPGTHVLIIGVGKYAYGKGSGATLVGGDLQQLTSPPLSAKEFANWLIRSFKNTAAPLKSVSLLISEPQVSTYSSPLPGGNQTFQVPPATLTEVKEASARWATRLASHQDNMGILYFCGHGVSQGQQAALLLEDFGKDGAAYEGAIDVNILRGTMKNSPAIRQAYLLDCCRTKADDLYKNEESIGTRIVSIPSLLRGHSIPTQQFVLFPTIDGEEAFGIQNQVSVFTGSIIDAMEFAAADNSTGTWRTTTGRLFDSVDQLVKIRVPARLINRSKPNALDATSFDFNEVDEPRVTRSFVTISDLNYWGKVELECVDPTGSQPAQKKHSKSSTEACCRFALPEGRWQFNGALASSPPNVHSHQRILRAPVAYVKLEVV